MKKNEKINKNVRNSFDVIIRNQRSDLRTLFTTLQITLSTTFKNASIKSRFNKP